MSIRLAEFILAGLILAPKGTAAVVPVVYSPTQLTVTPGVTVAYSILASNQPTAFQVTNLPSAWTIDPTNGVVLGQTAPAGMVGSNYTFGVLAANAAGTSAPVQVTYAVTAAAVVAQQYQIGPPMDSAPVPFWVSQPVLPDDTVLVTGGNLTNTTQAQLAVLDNGSPGLPTLPVLGFLPWGTVIPGTATSRSLHVGIPATWSVGIYALRLANGTTHGPAILVDAPDPWFAMGDTGMEVSPGGTLYVAGHCLAYGGNPSTIALVQNGAPAAILTGTPLTSDERGWGYAVSTPLPALPPGLYEVWVHNGFGGANGWAKVADPLSVIPPFSWPPAQVVFDSQSGTNDDARMAAAMTALGNHGGTILLPARTLNFTASLSLTNYCRLQGVSNATTILSFATNCVSPLINGARYTDGVHRGTFALEDLKIYAPAGYTNVAVQRAYQPSYLPGWLKRVVVQMDALPAVGGNVGIGVFVRQTTDFVMEDCTIDSDMPVAGYDTVFGLRLTRCTLDWRDSSLYLRGMTTHVLVNDCTFNLRGNPTNNTWVAMTNPNPGIWFGAFKSGVGSIGGQFIKNVLLANCVHTRDDHSYALPAYVGFTTDGETSIYNGPFTASGTNLTLPVPTTTFLTNGVTVTAAAYDWAGCRASILQGAGAGQHRTVVRGAVPGQTNLVLDRAWDVAPDASSMIDIGCQVGNTLMISNDWSEARLVQYYFSGVNNTLAGGWLGSSDGQATACIAWSGYHYQGWLQSAQMQFLSSQNRYGPVQYRNVTADFSQPPFTHPYYVAQTSLVIRDQRETNQGSVHANTSTGYVSGTNVAHFPVRDFLIERLPGPVGYAQDDNYGGSYAVRAVDTNGTTLPGTAIRLSDAPYAWPVLVSQDYATWAAAQGLTNTDLLATDAAGQPNLLAYSLGLSPWADAGSPLSFAATNADFVFRFTRPNWVTNVTYTLQTSSDLRDWSNAVPQPGIEAAAYTNASLAARVPGNLPRSFLRLQVTSP